MFAFLVLLDACVLIRDALRDTLLRAAAEGLCRVYWSDDILEEVRRNLLVRRGRTSEQVRRIVSKMESIAPDARVTDYERWITAVPKGVPEEDRHVVAAAKAADVHIIVTTNLSDFPDESLRSFGVEAWHPDKFLRYLLKRAPQSMADIIVDQAAALIWPPKTTDELLDDINQVCPSFVAGVRRILDHR